MKAKLALGSAPAVSTPFLAAGVTSPTSFRSVFLHHRPKRIDARGQAEPIEACRHLVPSFAHSPGIRRSQSNRCCANSLHGVAFLSWNRHPEPTGSRRATPLLLFQHSPGQSRKVSAATLSRPQCFSWRLSARCNSAHIRKAVCNGFIERHQKAAGRLLSANAQESAKPFSHIVILTPALPPHTRRQVAQLLGGVFEWMKLGVFFDLE